MKKIVFFCIPAHGHTNPTLGVVRELISRGHQVWYYSYNIMREKIESTGATFISCDDYDIERSLVPQDAARVGKDIAFSTKLLVDTALALDGMLCRDMEKLKPDCIVADSMAVWGKAIALKLDIPFVSSTTTFAFNKNSAKIMRRNIGELIRLIFSVPQIDKQIKRLQSNGYPVKSILDIIQNDNNTNTIVYTSPEFQPFSETFSDKYTFVGPSVRSVTAKIEKNADKLVYISMGTVNNDMMPLYRRCLSSFANTDYQVIMSVGNTVSIENFRKLPKNISVFPYVDQMAVLQQADVFVSHCGMNSVSESLFFGVPLVMLPQTAEQKGVARQVSYLKTGIRLNKSDGHSILKAVNAVLSDSSYKENANRISESFKRCPGAKGAADKIIQVCERIHG